MVKMSSANLYKVNRSCRSGGAVGENPRCYRALNDFVDDSYSRTVMSVLDYGAGLNAIHTRRLGDAGWVKVTAYDIGRNVQDHLHNPQALLNQYDVVIASNVLNVQCTPDMLRQTLNELRDAVKPGGLLLANYPASPRYCNVGTLGLGRRLRLRGLYSHSHPQLFGLGYVRYTGGLAKHGGAS